MRAATEIGWTAEDPRVWGIAVNAEVKLLLFGIAFEFGFDRVKIQADAFNERSRAAIAGLGETVEGIMRRDFLRADGSWLNSAVYSIVRDDWPQVRAGLEPRLERHGDRPVPVRSRSMRLGSCAPCPTARSR